MTAGELVTFMRKQLEGHEHRSATIVGSLERLSDNVARLPEAASGQLAALTSMRELLEQHAARARRFEENVAQLPQLADAQRETMTAVARQLDGTRQTNERVANALDNFRNAVESLHAATTGSTAALRQMHTDSLAREERTVGILEQQTRRFMFAACVMILTAAVLTALVLLPTWLR